MRPLITIALVLTVFLWSLSWAGEVQAPRMVLDEVQHDAGVVRQGESIEHAFEVRNEGNKPLEIRKVSPG
jgi:hypothetical protein